MRPPALARAAVRVALVVSAAALVVAVVASGWPALVGRPILLYGHHGDLSSWPENTLEGLEAAAAAGLDGVELDVGRSTDGTFWLMHDETVDRTTTGSGRVDGLSDAELAPLTIDGGIGYDPARHTGLRVPRLDDALDALRGIALVVDVKSTDPAVHAAAARVLVDRGRPDAAILCQSVGGATAVKAVDRRLSTIYGIPITWHPDVDLYLVRAFGGFGFPEVPYSDFFGDTVLFVDEEYDGDEAAILDEARRWGVAIAVVNRPAEDLAWRAGR
jgi:glycerophosphoryl diester phosphodiesterase